MGLSRNKVAVSEGAAGSPPFYGDTDMLSRTCRIVSRQKTKTDAREMHELRKSSLSVVQFSGFKRFSGASSKLEHPFETDRIASDLSP